MKTILRSATGTVTVGPEEPFVVVGERINPTGREELAEELRRGDLASVRADAVAQVEAGAPVLDVNVGAAGVDEARILPEAVAAVQEVVDVPLCIDSSDADAMEAALDVCEGKPLVNSVTAEERSLRRLLPLVHERGAAVVGLAHGEEGIPSDADGRLRAAERILAEADRIGIAPEDVIVDPLVMSVGADPRAAAVALATISRVRDELGVNLICGASNVSHGLPGRAPLGAAFLTMAMHAGLSSAIANPESHRVMEAVRAAEVVLGIDRFATRWIRRHREAVAAAERS